MNFRQYVIIAELWRYEVALHLKNLRFLEKQPLTVKFSKLCSERFHRNQSTCCVQILWNLADRKLVKLCIAYLTKIICLAPTVTRIALKICQGQLPTMYLECSRFHPNRFTFGGVIAKRMNSTKTRHKVNPIFGWGLALSRTIIVVVGFQKIWLLLMLSKSGTFYARQLIVISLPIFR